VLGLGEQVRRGDGGVGRCVGDDEDLAGPRDHVDPRAPENELLGRGHPGVARPHDLVDGRNGSRPVRHRRHGLGAAHLEDPVDACDLRRRRKDGVEPSPADGARHDDFPHPGDPRGDGRHEHRRGVRGKTAGNVDPHAVEGNNSLAQLDAPPLVGPGLETLPFVVLLDASRRKLQDRPLPLRHPAQGLADLERGDLDGLFGQRHAVESLRVGKQGPVPPLLDIPEDGEDLLFEGRIEGLPPVDDPLELPLESPVRCPHDPHDSVSLPAALPAAGLEHEPARFACLAARGLWLP